MTVMTIRLCCYGHEYDYDYDHVADRLQTWSMPMTVTMMQVLCKFGPMVFSRTELESSHMGRYLSDLLQVLINDCMSRVSLHSAVFPACTGQVLVLA
jgi:hypothetical protein